MRVSTWGQITSALFVSVLVGMVSGSQTVVPTAAGNYTYTLSCTGTGGTESASASVVSQSV
jgi:hypothetical protein